ncbi:response regulator transcription factor [Apibacter muscae]|uniref:Response regulator transcription factor n=1 Tax=Apibacter muscae TaxID=2509004 RepID=A0A563D8Q2_9FLAO|nr:LytTR family DNA-binding domain-containing protein [Apibacter muscae]TWP26560.1 response regulator transcription factor [Apibacter muscae]TWP28134.1 response regulator transcription factor [Apibacter muscae]
MNSNKISCIIVDDEPMALQLIENYVNQTAYLELIGKFNNAIEVLDFINKQKVDLIFLDIQMPELNGLQLAETIKDHTKIIFTTAFDQYALEGYKVNALDYLLKPFDYKEFILATNKAKEWFELIHAKEQKELDKKQSPEYFFVKSEYRQIKISFHKILYIEGLKDYVKIWLKDEPKPILTLMSLKKLEEELPKDRFMRVHRSFIISLEHIQSIEKNQVIIHQQYITISDQHKESFYKFIQSNSIN